LLPAGDPDPAVGLYRPPHSNVAGEEFAAAKTEMVRPFEWRRLTRLCAAAEYHASQGMVVERHGTPAASDASATGLTVSGAEVVSIRSTLSLTINDLAS
jgi:hypothetical protein